MEFNDVYEIAQYFDEKHISIAYPVKPSQPSKKDYKSHAEYGVAMDAWEAGVAEWREKHKQYSEAGRAINEQFKAAVLEYLELTDHPKAEKFWAIVWERGHSGGYSEIVIEAEELAELLQ